MASANVDVTHVNLLSPKSVGLALAGIVMLVLLYLVASRFIVPWLQAKVPGVARVTGAGGSGGLGSTPAAFQGI
ncbi:MAG: hypothetical protein QOE90_928 [Thermoplasmata archaeon]|jgi:hypothetical protein|nr:hypothetical protein [Thermoplasmata archaeon]